MRRILGTSALILLIVAAALFIFFREQIIPAWQLFRVDRAGRAYYANADTLVRDVQYSTEFDTRLDVHRPEANVPGDVPDGVPDGGFPVVIFVHGGGWNEYDKQFFAPVGMILSRRNVVTVVPDYTLYSGEGVPVADTVDPAPPADDPDYGIYKLQARETAAAIAWTLENIGDFGGDPARVVVSGHSAGAHLAALALFDERYLAALDHEATEACAFLGLSGVYDIEAQKRFNNEKGEDIPIMRAVMGGEANFDAASPSTFVRAALPPVTLIHGARDDTVPTSISMLLDGALRGVGATSEFILYPEATHESFLFDALTDDDAPILRDILRVVDSCE